MNQKLQVPLSIKHSSQKFLRLLQAIPACFVIKVNGISAKTPAPAEMVEQQKSNEESRIIQAALGQSFNSLKKMAKIKDNRSKFF